MRKFINIIESPIADFEFIGSKEEEGSFERSDLKTMSHPTWEARLLKTFNRTKEPINIYVMNFKRDQYVKTRIGSREYDLRPPESADSGYLEWNSMISGQYTAKLFEEQFGFIPPNVKTSITLALTHNFGDDKIPITPWMVVHRMMHAMNHQNSSDWRKASSDSVALMNKAIRSLYNAFREIIPPALNGSYFAHDVEELARSCSNLKSAHNGITRIGELVLELIGQYFITGDFYFDLSKAPKHPKQDIEEANYCLGTARDNLDIWRDSLLGTIVVL